MERLWHSTRKMKPPVDQVVVGCWIDADDVMFVSLCFLDDKGHWYLAQDGLDAWDERYKMPKCWIERPNY